MRNLISIFLILIAGGCTPPASPRKVAHSFLQGIRNRDLALIENTTCTISQAEEALANTPALTAENIFNIQFYSETLNGDQATEKFYTITRQNNPDTTLWEISLLRVRDNNWEVYTPALQKEKY